MGGGEVRWLAVLPQKQPAAAKSRLRGAVPRELHADLVVAMTLDTVAAVVSCPLVAIAVVVCDEPEVRVAVAGLGAYAVPDVPGAGLNPALAHGAATAGRLLDSTAVPSGTAVPGGTVAPVVVLTADLPALRTAELTAALAAASAAGRHAFVPDAAGTGTVLLAAPSATDLAPAFGPGSADAHAAAGAHRLGGDWPGLRCDVDTGPDLAAAVAIGVGRHTAALLARPAPGAGPPATRPPAGTGRGSAGTVSGMRTTQGTVATFDADTQAGTVLLDDGTEVAFPPAAFAASGLRLLRLGQRVRLEYGKDDAVARVALVTLP